jgi:hypothetical protein
MTLASSGEVELLLRQTDSSDRRLIYLAWCKLGGVGQDIVPFVAEAYAKTREARGRESHLYYVTPYARFDDRAIELGVRALRDPRQEVRYRACALLAHSGRVEVVKELAKLSRGTSRAHAQRAIAALRKGMPFGPDDDASYFFYGHDPYRAPRGHFAVELQDELGAWLEERGFRPAYLFQHTFGYRDGERFVRADWDSYDVEARLAVRASARKQPTQANFAWGASGIPELGAAIRKLVSLAAVKSA